MTSLILATDLGGALTSRALAKAGQWLAPALLIAVQIILALLWWTMPGVDIWWASIWIALIGAGVVTALRAERIWTAVLSLTVAGGGGSYLYAMSLGSEFGSVIASDDLLLTLPKVAAVVAGVGGRSLRACLVLSTLGFVLTGAASIVAARRTEMILAFDVTACGAYIAVIGLLLVLWLARGDAQKGTSVMNLAGIEEEGLREEARIISHASSVLHDTVLNDLQSLALSPPGALGDAHLKRIEHDLELLSGTHDLLFAPRSDAISRLRSRAELSPLTAAIARAEARGMCITVSGDAAALAELAAPTEQAMVMAVDQCLVNVLRHSGVQEAEVAIAGSSCEVTVMVTDAGRGFDAQKTDSERLGLRLSVHDRIHAVGGSVQLWSSPGAGTAILLAAPTAAATAEVL